MFMYLKINGPKQSNKYDDNYDNTTRPFVIPVIFWLYLKLLRVQLRKSQKTKLLEKFRCKNADQARRH